MPLYKGQWYLFKCMNVHFIHSYIPSNHPIFVVYSVGGSTVGNKNYEQSPHCQISMDLKNHFRGICPLPPNSTCLVDVCVQNKL